jgi:DNA-binding NarL/FixJ family response regulator
MTVSVAVVDDQPIVRAGLVKLIEAEPGLTVAGEARDGIEAVQLARTARPDVILMDIRMPRLDGIEATKRIVAEHDRTRVIVLTTFGLDEYVVSALRNGASAFLLKDAEPDHLIAAIHVVSTGDAFVAPAATRRLLAAHTTHPTGEDPGALAALTSREREVFDLLARGNSNAEIANALVVAEATVKTHVANILAKLGLRDRVQAVILAYECGAIQPHDR